MAGRGEGAGSPDPGAGRADEREVGTACAQVRARQTRRARGARRREPQYTGRFIDRRRPRQQEKEVTSKGEAKPGFYTDNVPSPVSRFIATLSFRAGPASTRRPRPVLPSPA